MTTLGTGIGTALIYDGVLVPNSELGHLEIDGHDAETRAASSIKDKEGLTYPEWAERLQRYYSHLEALLWPDLYRRRRRGLQGRRGVPAAARPARPRSWRPSCENKAGIIGAAHLAAHK